MKPKTCKVCKEKFSPYNALQKVCGVDCALKHSKQVRDKAARRAERLVEATIRRTNREAKGRLKTRSQWLAEAQTVFNKYIRERDKDEPCISCGRYHSGQYHAGHYRTTAAAPELRFAEANCNKQCAPCNNHKSGNVVDYRIRLVEKIGLDAVEWVEGKHEPKKYTIPEIQEIKKLYKRKLKELM